jgi:hypothetical protein
MRNYAAYLMSVVDLHLAHLFAIGRYDGVDLMQETHCRVIE